MSNSKGKALKPPGATVASSPTKEVRVSGEATAFIPTAISDEIRIWQTNGLSTDDSKAISKRFELDFEDPTFSIKPPRLDGFMLRHAKDKDQVKAVNASEESLIQTQLKIMDIAPPLFDLYTKVCSLGEGETETETAARLRAKTGGKKVTVHPGQSTRVLRSRRVEREEFPVDEGQSRGMGRGRPSRVKSWIRGGGRYVSVTPSIHIKKVRHTRVSESVGGRLLKFAKIWETVIDDLWVLDCVSEGLKLDFVETPSQTRLSSPVAMSKEMAKICDKEVKELLEKKAIVEISNSGADGFVCSLLVIPKKNQQVFGQF